MNSNGMSLAALLSDRKNTLVKKWLERVLQTYPRSTTMFLSQEPDPFRNPVGHTLKEGLSELFDALNRPADAASIKSALDGIVRMRAVQDFSASQAVSFVFLLKKIISAELPADRMRFSEEFVALEARIDEMALLAFDVFMKCREQIYEIKANENKRMAFHLERTSQKGSP